MQFAGYLSFGLINWDSFQVKEGGGFIADSKKPARLPLNAGTFLFDCFSRLQTLGKASHNVYDGSNSIIQCHRYDLEMSAPSLVVWVGAWQREQKEIL